MNQIVFILLADKLNRVQNLVQCNF